MEILFVGTERVGHHVPQVSGKAVEFTGEYNHIDDVKDLIMSERRSVVIFDLSMFTDHYSILAEEIYNLSVASNARFIFYYLGRSPQSALVTSLIAKGFRLFVTESIAGQANQQLEQCLDGYATIEIPEEDLSETSQTAASGDGDPRQIMISVAGCCSRIGTTTQTLQIVKYLQLLGHKTCYIQMNTSGFVQSLPNYYSDVEINEDLDCFTYGGVDMFAAPEKIASIRSLDYEYFVYDFGNFQNFQQNTTVQFLEKDIRIIVGGISPSEMEAMGPIFMSPIMKSNVFYLFSFVHEHDRDEVLELMQDKSSETFFAKFTPDPFSYTADSNEMYQSVLHADKVGKRAQKKSRFNLFGIGKSAK